MIIQQLQQKLQRFSKNVEVVLATPETTGLILPSENSAYAHVYLFNVDAERMLDAEDAAYETWGQNQQDGSRAVCFFVYTPTETREKFPQYAIKAARCPCVSFMKRERLLWTPKALPVFSDCSLLAARGMNVNSPGLGGIIKPERTYMPVNTADIQAADVGNELLKAA